jgi:hypothetical protein
MGKVLTTPHRKNVSYYEIFTQSLGTELILWYDLSIGKETRNLVLNIRSLCRSGSLTAVVRELVRYKIVGVQGVRWDKGGAVRAGNYNFFMEKEKKIINWKRDFFVHHKIVSPVKRVEFVSDSITYIVMRCRWSNIIALKVPAPSEEKIDDSKAPFMRN